MSSWDLTDAELSGFFAKLTVERASMSLTLDQLRSAEVIVCERNEGVVAAIAGVRRVRGLAVAFFVVLASFQGQGLGKSLADRLHIKLRELRYRLVCLSVQRDNAPALRLYRASGYRPFFSKGRTIYMFRFL